MEWPGPDGVANLMRRVGPTSAALAVLVLALMPSGGHGQVERSNGANVGQFFAPIIEPIRQEDIDSLRSSVLAYIERTTNEGERPILVFEFRPGEVAPGETSFGAAIDLADFLARELGGAKQTVAYVPESLTGFAVLPVLACGEIVLGPEAALGPIGLTGRTVTNRERESVRQLGTDKGRDVDLLLGLLEPARDLRQVRTADGSTHFVLAENLKAFKEGHQVLEDLPAWEGRRGVLSPARARQTIARLQAEDRARVAEAYNLASTAIDPTHGTPTNPILIPIHGRLDPLAESFIERQIVRAKEEGANFIVFEIKSEGGLYDSANKIAEAIARLEGIKTVGFIDGQALGMAALVPLACDQIVMRKGSQFGDMRRQIVDSSGDTAETDERLRPILAERVEELAREKGHSAAIARAMVDPEAIVLSARDKQVGAVVTVLQDRAQAEPGRYEVLGTVKSADGAVLTLNDQTAPRYQMADKVVRDLDELQTAYGLRNVTLRLARRTWVDSLVDTLNEPWMRGILLFVGFFMLMLELKLPGVGLPAILSTLAFLLYFWSSYLGGTAGMLEVILFVVGVLCVGIEIFIFPGLAIFGMSGAILILASVVMASHTFVMPTNDYEYRELAWSVLRIVGVIFGTILAIVVVGKFFPSIPIFNRLILKPEDTSGPELAPGEKPSMVGADTPYAFLFGEVGRTTTPLRPSGKARFGELLVDVTADGFWIGADVPVEVIEARGSRIVVKRV